MCRFWDKIGDFFCEISTKSGIWMKCSHDGFFARIFARFARFRTIFARIAFSRFFFARIFARFARFRTIFARPAFSRFFFRTNFRTFRTVSHDFRTTCFFKVFCSHVLRVFARSSHAGRRPACLCQIRSKSAQILRKSLVSIGAPKNFWIFTKKTLTSWKWTHRNVLGICTVDFVWKLKILQTFWFFWLKNLLANLNWTLQNFPQKNNHVCFRFQFSRILCQNWSLSSVPDGFDEKTDGPAQIKHFRAFRNKNRQHAFQITFFKYFCLSCGFHSIWHCGFSCFNA